MLTTTCSCDCQVLRTVVLAALALFTILLSFPLGYFFYAVVFGIEELPALAIMSVFLVLGISVDIVFVLCTSYIRSHDSSLLEGSDAANVEARILARALHHAIPIISVATATSAVAFVAGMASPLVPVRQFSL